MQQKILLSEVDEIIAGGPDENQRVALCRMHGNEGIIDVEGNVIVPFRYSSINGYVWDSSGLLAVVSHDGLLGHVDIHGNEVIPCQFPFYIAEEAPYFCFCEDRFPVLDRNNLIGFINPRGEKVIPGRFHKVRHFSNGRCAVMNEQGLWGYIDEEGKLVIDYQFLSAYNFDATGVAHVCAKTKTMVFFTRQVYLHIDKQGRIIAEKQ